jgi:hypothetical protein
MAAITTAAAPVFRARALTKTDTMGAVTVQALLGDAGWLSATGGEGGRDA